MYVIVTIKDTVRIPPDKFDEPIEKVAAEILNDTYVGKIDKKLGIMIIVTELLDIEIGKVVIGDGAAYSHITFNALFFKPNLHEIIEGEVIEIIEFGAFIRIGPMDGLVHVSQITDDFITYDMKQGALIAKESSKILDEQNIVRARIVALSLKGQTSKESKIGLTMRQPGLGRLEWIEEEKERKKK